jgi:hypothetical protein
VINIDISTPLSPESLTAVEILESISVIHRNQALEMLRNFAHELRSEQKWEELYSKQPGPRRKMATQALKEHREGKSRKQRKQ